MMQRWVSGTASGSAVHQAALVRQAGVAGSRDPRGLAAGPTACCQDRWLLRASQTEAAPLLTVNGTLHAITAGAARQRAGVGERSNVQEAKRHGLQQRASSAQAISCRHSLV